MSKISELLELVHSLTRTEQGEILNVLKSHTRGNTNQQLDLFTALLNSSPAEDEKSIPRQLGPKHRKNLPTLMRRLYALILENLGMNGTEQEVSSRLNNAISAVAVLYEKQLHQQSEKVLKKAMKLAEAYEQSNHHLQLIHWERKLIRAQRRPDTAALLQSLYQQQAAIAREMSLQLETRNLRDQVLELIRNKVISPQDKKDRLHETVNLPILQTCRYARDMRSRINAKATLGTCLFELGRTEEAVTIYSELLDLWVAHPDWINEYPEDFMEDFNLFQSMILRDSDRMDLLEKHAETIKKLPLARPNLQFRFKYYGFQLQIVAHLNFLKWDEARKVIQEALEWMRVDHKMFTTSHRMAFLYNFAVFHFFQDEFSAAKKFATQIVDTRGKSKRLDLVTAARLINLVINIEEKEYDFAEYQLRATRTWLKRHSLESPFSKSFLRLVQHIIDGGGLDLRERILQQKAPLSNLPPIQGSNEIIIWMESKLRNISLKEVCEELIPEMQ
jgi:tetratricopeptide (TPR) repeat protein